MIAQGFPELKRPCGSLPPVLPGTIHHMGRNARLACRLHHAAHLTQMLQPVTVWVHKIGHDHSRRKPDNLAHLPLHVREDGHSLVPGFP